MTGKGCVCINGLLAWNRFLEQRRIAGRRHWI